MRVTASPVGLDVHFEGGGCWLNVVPQERYVQTVFGAGLVCAGRPQDDRPHYQALADLMGGGCPWRYLWVHEFLHNRLADLEGDRSPSLWAAANGRGADRETDAEEQRVLLFQMLLALPPHRGLEEVPLFGVRLGDLRRDVLEVERALSAFEGDGGGDEARRSHAMAHEFGKGTPVAR